MIEPHLPRPPRYGRPRAWPQPEIVNGIFYVLCGASPSTATGASQEHFEATIDSARAFL